MSIKQSVVFRKTGGLDVGIGCQEVVWCLYLENSDVIDGVDAVILRVVYDADNLQDEGHGLGLYPEVGVPHQHPHVPGDLVLRAVSRRQDMSSSDQSSPATLRAHLVPEEDPHLPGIIIIIIIIIIIPARDILPPLPRSLRQSWLPSPAC